MRTKTGLPHFAQLLINCCTYGSQDNFVKIMLDDDTLHSQFIDLDYDLLKLSHEVLFS